MNKHDLKRNEYMLSGSFKRKGYDWWWQNFNAIDPDTNTLKPFFIEFFICNPKKGKDYPVLGQLKENKEKGIKPSYLMVKVGTWGEDHIQLHRFFGINNVKIHKKAPFSIECEDCFISDTHTFGNVSVTNSKDHPEWMCDDGSISWDLNIEKLIAFNVGYGASKFFRSIKAFEMYWHAEGMKSKFNGHITLNGKKYIVNSDLSYGYCDKNWGRNFTSPWVWLSSWNLVSNITGKKLENSVFDIGGGKPKVYFLPLNRKLLGELYYEGVDYEFNFSKFWTKSKTKFECTETDDEIIWNVEQKNRSACLVTNIKCLKKDMLFVNYESPDGKKRHNRLFNGGNATGNLKLYKKNKKDYILIDDIDVFNCGCEYGEYNK